MKTPREMLLARHQAVEPKLDALRREAVAAVVSGTGALASLSPTGAPACRTASEGACKTNDRRGHLSHYREAAREIFLRPRLAWSALAMAWLVIITLNFATPESSSPGSALATATPPASPETLQALREQKRLFTELVGGMMPGDAETPRFVPRPRSERQPLTACA